MSERYEFSEPFATQLKKSITDMENRQVARKNGLELPISVPVDGCTDPQWKFLQALGYRGEKPKTKKEASELITLYKSKRGN